MTINRREMLKGALAGAVACVVPVSVPAVGTMTASYDPIELPSKVGKVIRVYGAVYLADGTLHQKFYEVCYQP